MSSSLSIDFKKLRQNSLSVSNLARFFIGPKQEIDSSSNKSATPISNGFSGPIITKSMLYFLHHRSI